MRISFAFVCLLTIGAVVAPTASTHQDRSDTLQRFFTSGTPALTSYRARRVLEATTLGGRMTARLEAWTSLNPDGTFRFEVDRESGSHLLRQRVLVAALRQEQRTRNQKETGQAELTPLNYDFLVNDGGDNELVRICLLPRRRSRMLLNGTLLVKRDDGDLVRIEGRLSERPSFWTRQVDIVRCYARIGGVRVPVDMRSRADVLVGGDSSFSMTYDYRMINGRKVAGADIE